MTMAQDDPATGTDTVDADRTTSENCPSNDPSNDSKGSLTQQWLDRVQSEWAQVSEKGTKTVILHLFIPLGILFLGIGTIWALAHEIGLRLLALFGLYFFTPLGMEIGVPVAIWPIGETFHGFAGLGLDPVVAVGFMLWVDIMAAMLLTWNFWFFRILPFFGRILIWTEKMGQNAIEKYPWIGKLRLVGLVLFVMIPLYGSGSILGTVVGKALGTVNWKIWMAVVFGSGTRLSLLALGYVWLFNIIPPHQLWIIVVVIIVSVVTAYLTPKIVRSVRREDRPLPQQDEG